MVERAEGPSGNLIGPRKGKRSAAPGARAGNPTLALLRTLTLSKSQGGASPRPTLAQLMARPAVPDGAELRRAIEEFDQGALTLNSQAQIQAGVTFDAHLDDPALLGAAPLELRREAFSRRARLLHGQGRATDAALDWLACSSFAAEKIPPAVIPWVALNRIRAGDASAVAVRFYTDHVQEIDRVIKDRPGADRESLFRALESVCQEDSDAGDAQIVALARRLLQLNGRRPGFGLVLGVRLLHDGQLKAAGDALHRAGEAAEATGFRDRRQGLRLLHLHLGAVELSQGDAAAARLSFRKAMALDPGGLEAPLMYAELEARLGRREDRLNRRRALRLVERVSDALAAEAALRPWLKAAVTERCAVLRSKLSVGVST